MNSGREEGRETRRAIMAVLAECKGVHKSELRRAVGIGWGNIGGHLQVLINSKHVETEVHGRLLWIFERSVTRNERDLLIALKGPLARRLLEVIGVKPRSTIRALSEELVVSKKMIRTHLSHLRRAGVVKQVEGHPPAFEAIPAYSKRQ